MHPSILKTKGPCLILAGAGTGKTHTIVEKIKYFISQKIYPTEKILCLTFSNEASNSLRSRILPILSSEHQGKEPTIKTFHAFCSDLLKKYGEKIGISKFNILLPDDAKIILHKNFKISPFYCNPYISEIGISKDLGISTKELESYLKSKTLLTTKELEKDLEFYKFELLTTKDKEKKKILKEKSEHLEKLLKSSKFLKIWKAYEKFKTLKNLLDYSDLNRLALKLLKQNPEIASEFSYVIVDEFQDTNKLQCDLLRFLSPKKNITVVGDQNQSIYRFRGAYKNNLSNFKKIFSVSKSDIFTLKKSYRSTNNILEISHDLIRNNYSNNEECFKILNFSNEYGIPTKIFQLENNKEETRKILEIINNQLSLGISPSEICVIFRTHKQSKLLKNALEFQKIDYTSITKKSLLKIPIIKLIRDYLIILHKIKTKSPEGSQAWWDLIHQSQFSKEDELILTNFIKENKSNLLSIKLLNLKSLNLSQKGKIQFKAIQKNLISLIPKSKNKTTEILKDIFKILGLNSKEKEKILILEKFFSLAQEQEAIETPILSDFLHHLEIMDSLGIEVETPELNNKGIRIMTSHSTKGLEYKTVIISNFVQKKFPIERISSPIVPSELSPELLEFLKEVPEEEKENYIKEYERKNQLLEERRLAYVSLTRTKENLFITFAKKYSSKKFPPSQFLNEINYKENKNIEFIIDSEEKYLEPEIPNLKPIEKENKKLIFSPSSLQTFDECQKKYEFKYIYNMPEPIPTSWEFISLGSFVHKVLEEGVSANFKTEKSFLDLAKCLSSETKWQFVELPKAEQIIKVFFHRNKNKYNEKSKTEIFLSSNISGILFSGIADRIDFNKNNEIEIIDYKTGTSQPKPKYRNWQLGFYALASKSLGVPKKLTLDFLQKENSLEFLLDSKGDAVEINSQRIFFNLEEVREQLIETANKIKTCQISGFSACPIEKSCAFCEEWIY